MAKVYAWYPCISFVLLFNPSLDECLCIGHISRQLLMLRGLRRCIKYSFAYVSVFRDGIYVPWKTFWHACDMLHSLLINESWPIVFIELVIMVYQNMFLCRRKQHIQKSFGTGASQSYGYQERWSSWTNGRIICPWYQASALHLCCCILFEMDEQKKLVYNKVQNQPIGIDVLRTTIQNDYKNDMNDVDIPDQLCKMYCFNRWLRNRKWWWAICMWVLGVIFTNVYVAYVSTNTLI